MSDTKSLVSKHNTQELNERSQQAYTSICRDKLRDPLRKCAAYVLLGFVIFVSEGIPAIVLHNQDVLVISAVIDGTLLLVLIGAVAWTILTEWDALEYNGNLINTISSCIFTILMCMLLYPLIWYPSLNREMLQEVVEDVDSLTPPALAWITINDRRDVAHLLDYPHPKGFMSDIAGGFGSDVVSCDSQSQEEILAYHVCNCSDMFSPVQHAPLANHTGGISFRSFVPATNIQMNSTDATLVLQVYSDHNTSGTPVDWMLPGPMWLLMLYDPGLSIMDAFTTGKASVTHVAVLGSTTIVMEPERRIGWGADPYYYYGMRATSIPSLNDICDVNNGYITWCYTTVVVQFADMTRTVRTRTKAASPGDVFAQVGGYFALVQFLCWIVSTMALR